MKKSEIITVLEELKKSYKKSFDFHQAVVEKNAICKHVLNVEEYPPYGTWGGVEEYTELCQQSVANESKGRNLIIDLTNLGKADTYWKAFTDIDYLLADIKEGE
jgi:hypothetical protein